MHARQGEIIMPIPQVNDRIKEAPVVVLRAVFAGIGQLLLTADKVRARAVEQVWTPDQPAGPGPAGPSPSWAATATKTAPGTKATAATKTAPAGKATTKPAPAAKPAAAKVAPTTKPASGANRASTTKPVSEAKAAPAAKAAPPATPAPAAPPLPGYDDLSLPSLRARLRTLDATTIKAMLAYEKAHARRDEVISMLERRLAKITAE
jgi:hypothetical protein